jgi:hypothetical protein
LDIVERGGRNDGEADEEDVSLRVGERPKAVVVFLAGCVPKSLPKKHKKECDARLYIELE